MELQEEIAEYALEYALSKGASYAEVRLEHRAGNGFLLKNGVPESAEITSAAGMGVRFVVNGALGLAAVSKLSKEGVREELDAALSITRASSRACEKTIFSEEKSARADFKAPQKKKLADFGAEEKLAALKSVDEALVSAASGVVARYFSLSDELLSKFYCNSEGSRIRSEIPYVNLFYSFTIAEGAKTIQRFTQFGATTGYECLAEWKLEQAIAREAKALKKNLVEARQPPTEKVDVILAPEVTGIAAHESGGHPYEADRIFGREAAQAGESFVKKDMTGFRIGSSEVNIADDPTLPGSFGFVFYDDEGVKARKKRTVEKGVIKEFLHNRETAAAMKLKSNGCARANFYSVEPMVRMSNTFVEPGSFSEEELLEDVKLGVYFKNFMEWNIDDVRYQQRYVGNEAYLVEDGELTSPVARPVLEITTKELWSS
ncbi:MAG: TldD/PmbA family protein, partial [Candidatus Micrarchaeia archaeon]